MNGSPAPPVANGYAAVNGNGDVNGHADGFLSKFTSGLILPPPEVKSIIDRTATFVARSANPPQFEDKIRENQRSDPKFSFLNPADPYHAYYRHRMDKVAQGEVDDEPGAVKEGAAAEEAVQPVSLEDMGTEPPPAEFIFDTLKVPALDMDIMKLTALFAAQRGRPFLASLAAKEGRNPQFEFLKPTHTMFAHFNQLLEQYQRVLLPAPEQLKKINERAQEGAKWSMLETARGHATWLRRKTEREKKREADLEAERTAFAEIDWHDYAIVQTIEFTAADANAELPLPMSVQEVESMTQAQKRMAAMVMEEAGEDVEVHRANQAAAEAAAASSAERAEEEDAAMEVSDEEGDAGERAQREEQERQREIERAKAIQASSMQTGAPMKIRTDYVSKVGQRAKVTLTTCSICKQQVPVNELDEHMRIELLDPKWKSQRDALEARRAQASELQRGANVVESLNNLARSRMDIFGATDDEERRKREEEEERERRKAREKNVWDGHTASKEGTLNKYSTNVNFDEQIAAIHRAKGLGPQESNAIGPGIGPAAIPPPMSAPPPVALPNKPVGASTHAAPAYEAATVSSGPQPASMYPNAPAPVMLPPLHYQGLDSAQPFSYQPPPGALPAARAPPPFAGGTAANSMPLGGGAGTVRRAEEMDAGADDDVPPAKRQRVAKLPTGQYYPEADWVAMHPHPIALRVQLPVDASKPEYKLEGQIVTIPEVPVTYFVSTLRERVVQATGSALAPGRLRIAYAGAMLTNSNTIASYNLEDEDLLTASVQDRKKK